MSPPESPNGHLLAITAIGRSRKNLAQSLIRGILERGCHLQDVRINPLGNCLSATFLVSGNWSALGRLESALPGLGEQLELTVNFARTDAEKPQTEMRPYGVEVIAPRRDDLLTRVLEFFAAQGVHTNEIVMQNYRTNQTGAEMCNLQMMAHIPINQHPQALRESFMDLCDDLNADGLLDPIKT